MTTPTPRRRSQRAGLIEHDGTHETALASLTPPPNTRAVAYLRDVLALKVPAAPALRLARPARARA